MKTLGMIVLGVMLLITSGCASDVLFRRNIKESDYWRPQKEASRIGVVICRADPVYGSDRTETEYREIAEQTAAAIIPPGRKEGAVILLAEKDREVDSLCEETEQYSNDVNKSGVLFVRGTGLNLAPLLQERNLDFLLIGRASFAYIPKTIREVRPDETSIDGVKVALNVVSFATSMATGGVMPMQGVTNNISVYAPDTFVSHWIGLNYKGETIGMKSYQQKTNSSEDFEPFMKGQVTAAVSHFYAKLGLISDKDVPYIDGSWRHLNPRLPQRR